MESLVYFNEECPQVGLRRPQSLPALLWPTSKRGKKERRVRVCQFLLYFDLLSLLLHSHARTRHDRFLSERKAVIFKEGRGDNSKVSAGNSGLHYFHYPTRKSIKKNLFFSVLLPPSGKWFCFSPLKHTIQEGEKCKSRVKKTGKLVGNVKREKKDKYNNLSLHKQRSLLTDILTFLYRFLTAKMCNIRGEEEDRGGNNRRGGTQTTGLWNKRQKKGLCAEMGLEGGGEKWAGRGLRKQSKICLCPQSSLLFLVILSMSAEASVLTEMEKPGKKRKKERRSFSRSRTEEERRKVTNLLYLYAHKTGR